MCRFYLGQRHKHLDIECCQAVQFQATTPLMSLQVRGSSAKYTEYRAVARAIAASKEAEASQAQQQALDETSEQNKILEGNSPVNSAGSTQQAKKRRRKKRGNALAANEKENTNDDTNQCQNDATSSESAHRQSPAATDTCSDGKLGQFDTDSTSMLWASVGGIIGVVIAFVVMYILQIAGLSLL